MGIKWVVSDGDEDNEEEKLEVQEKLPSVQNTPVKKDVEVKVPA